ncbi:hypothetical protein HOG98_06805 [bacterium]|nr:hypothetical protein [bacterium]
MSIEGMCAINKYTSVAKDVELGGEKSGKAASLVNSFQESTSLGAVNPPVTLDAISVTTMDPLNYNSYPELKHSIHFSRPGHESSHRSPKGDESRLAGNLFSTLPLSIGAALSGVTLGSSSVISVVAASVYRGMINAKAGAEDRKHAGKSDSFISRVRNFSTGALKGPVAPLLAIPQFSELLGNSDGKNLKKEINTKLFEISEAKRKRR